MIWVEAIIIFVLLVFLLTAVAASAAPWLPTWNKDMERILKLADLKAGEVFYDLGAGDGRLIVAAARLGAKAVGLEFSLLPYIMAEFRLWREKNNAEIIFKDFFKQNLSDADIVYMFLTPPVMPKIKTKLEAELKKGTRVISYSFAVPGWEPVKKDVVSGRPNIYLYKV